LDVRLSRSSKVRRRDPHQWQNFQQYKIIQEKRLSEHPFVDQTHPNTLAFEERPIDDVLFVHMQGEVYCKQEVILIAEQLFETRFVRGVVQVRGIQFRYVGFVKGGNLLLKYHNLHESLDEYIHRAYSPSNGEEIIFETLTHSQFPTFPEVLDELELIASA